MYSRLISLCFWDCSHKKRGKGRGGFGYLKNKLFLLICGCDRVAVMKMRKKRG